MAIPIGHVGWGIECLENPSWVIPITNGGAVEKSILEFGDEAMDKIRNLKRNIKHAQDLPHKDMRVAWGVSSAAAGPCWENGDCRWWIQSRIARTYFIPSIDSDKGKHARIGNTFLYQYVETNKQRMNTLAYSLHIPGYLRWPLRWLPQLSERSVTKVIRVLDIVYSSKGDRDMPQGGKLAPGRISYEVLGWSYCDSNV